MDTEEALDKRASEGSAGWRLTSLWRPISSLFSSDSSRSSVQTRRSSIKTTNRTSVKTTRTENRQSARTTRNFDVNVPHISMSFPSLTLDRIPSLPPRPETSNDDLALLLDTQCVPTENIDASKVNNSPSNDTDTFRSAREEPEAEISRPATALSWMNLPACPQPGDDISRPISTFTVDSHLTPRPESRDIRYLAELPAIPMKIKSVRYSRPLILDVSKRAVSEQPTFDKPPVPPPKEAQITTTCEKQDRSEPSSWTQAEAFADRTKWPTCERWIILPAIGFISFCVSLASSITSAAQPAAASHFQTSGEVIPLITSTFMFGIAAGSLLWSTLHARYGRRPILLFGMIGFAAFQVPVAVAQNVQTVLICRFFAGVFGCSPFVAIMASLGGICDDLTQLDRGVAMSVFWAGSMTGTATGPLIGGPIVDSADLGWRWPSYFVLALCFPFGLACSMIYKESSASVLMKRHTKSFSNSTASSAPELSYQEAQRHLSRAIASHAGQPLLMLLRDPLLLLTTLYMSFAYGMLYLLVETDWMSFMGRRHWPFKLSGLPFAAVIVGALLGSLINAAFTRVRFAKLHKKYGRLCPEERLLPMLVGGLLLAGGLFLSGWTSYTWMTPVPEVIAGLPIGAGILLICLQGDIYLLDVYTTRPMQAIAASILVKSLFAAGFSAAARCFYTSLEPHWTFSILGGVAVALLPIPLLFYRYGVKLRAMSSFTPKLCSGIGDYPTHGFPVRGSV